MNDRDLDKLHKATVNCIDYVRLHILYVKITNLRDQINNTTLIYIHNNFIESAILKWSHIYGNRNDSLHYRKTLEDPDSFKTKMLSKIYFSEENWKDYWKQMKAFRDKRVAHIDPTLEIETPNLNIAFCTIAYFYETAIKILKASKRSETYKLYYDSIEKYAYYRESKYEKQMEKLISNLKD